MREVDARKSLIRMDTRMRYVDGRVELDGGSFRSGTTRR